VIAFLTWRIGALILGGLLAFVGAAGLIDGISNRATIRELRSANTQAQTARDDAKTSFGTCIANVETLGVRVDRLSGEINGLAAATAKNTIAAIAAAKANAANTKAAVDAAKALRERPLPPASEACSVAVQTLRGAIQ